MTFFSRLIFKHKIKSRRLACLLIFFSGSMLSSVFGQGASLAQTVFERYHDTLTREDIQEVLPAILNTLKDPAFESDPLIVELGGLDAALDLVLGNPDLLLEFLPDTDPYYITLLKTDNRIREFFKDPDVRTLMKDPDAVEELAGLLGIEYVEIPDPGLRAAIADALNKAPGDAITRADMETLVELWADFRDITDLRGIEFAINLTHLDLFGNTISDISPLASLTNLRELFLEENSISDISPLASLTKLTWLALDNNNISNILPLAGLTNLESLGLWTNSISDISPLASLTKLTELFLDENNISNILPLASLTNLTYLHLYSNNISNISPLASLIKLTYLNLGDNNISEIFPLLSLTNLTHLHLHSNNISDIDTLELLMAQGTVVYFSDNPAFETPGPKIEDGWVWLIVPATNVRSGSDAARSGRDFISEASGGAVTEADVALNGAQAGTRVGDSVWTAATLDASNRDNLNAIVRDYDLGIDIRYPVAYGVVPIQSETQQQTRVYIGGGPLKVWLNGTLVHRDTTAHFVDNYQTAVPVTLNVGKNLLFIAAYRPSQFSRWGAFFGFQDGTEYIIGAPGAGNLDVNGDGLVNVIDLAIVALFYGTRVPVGLSLPADVNADGIVNILDLTAVAQGIDAADTPNGFSADDVEVVLAAIADQANAIEGIAEAPARLRASQHARFSGVAARNVAAAFQAAKPLATDDARLRKWMPLLQELLELLSEITEIPETTTLLPNYPNPFNPETWIPYHLAKDAAVIVRIYNVSGGVVRELILGHQAVGVYESRGRAAYWDGRNHIGEKVASGVYFYTLTAGEFAATRKMLIRK